MKVICDVCGTTFPETATHCPICGCAKSPVAQTVAGDDMQMNQESSTANTYARGGRFAKSNVRRNSRDRSSGGRYSNDRNRQNNNPESNKGLIAVVIILLLAIIMVVVYIGVNVFLNDLGSAGGENQTTGSNQGVQGSQGSQTVACTSVKLNSKLVELKSGNEQYLLAVQKEPENTTDTVTFTSSNPAVATVDANGLVLPVGYGEAVITVNCGTASDHCTVVSTVGEPPAPPSSESQGASVPAGFVLKLETYRGSGEITIAGEGASHQLYKEIMGVKHSDITWTTSDPAVATVENGKVVGVDRGTCTITATIGDQTVTCLVRCSFDATPETNYQLSHASVTIGKGETFNLSLKDKATGANVQGVEWSASKDGIVEIDGNKITGGTVSKLTGVDVYTEYEGVKYVCKVFVKTPQE